MAIGTALLDPIVQIISDYRDGEIPKASAKHVAKWIEQFPENVREVMLVELEHVFHKTYFSRSRVASFLSKLVKNAKLTAGDPASFWRAAKCLEIQGAGGSQRDMLAMFDEALKKQLGFGVRECGTAKQACYVYLDDGLYTGNRILRDLSNWIAGSAPNTAQVHIVVIASHTGGQHYASEKLRDVSKRAGKKIEFTIWRIEEVEDRKSHTDNSDVLRPVTIPDDPRTQAYAQSLRFPPVLRKPGNLGPLKLFSSEESRNLLEQEFLKAGTLIREMCPNLQKYQRPLGNMVLETLGFGSMIITFRNCPNNAPLALWAGAPWYPLFQRKTN